MTKVSADEVERLERRAREGIAAGKVDDSVRLALDQLVADRTNGEPLDTAWHRLRNTLDHVEGGARTEQGERRAPP